MSMNAKEFGQFKGKSEPKFCVHQRMVSSHYNEKGQTTGNVVCQECGAVIPDPAKVLA
jgi:transcription elongation factor Elf1